MTAQQEPEHCGKEGVCIRFRTGSIVACRDGTPCMRNHEGCKSCENDTRKKTSEQDGYFLTRWGLEECYDALDLINGKPYADQVWEMIERDTRSRPHNPTLAIISVEPHPPGKEQLECDNTCPARCPGCEDTCPLWEHDEQVKREAREVQQEITPSADIIADLERSLEFYKARMNNLQCWQSSMRDPERKIVCDILANGFTLTTKEEICQHSRIYSPAQMQQAIAQAQREGAEEIFKRIESRAYSNDKLPIVYLCDIEVEVELFIKSLRLAQPEPTEREPE